MKKVEFSTDVGARPTTRINAVITVLIRRRELVQDQIFVISSNRAICPLAATCAGPVKGGAQGSMIRYEQSVRRHDNSRGGALSLLSRKRRPK